MSRRAVRCFVVAVLLAATVPSVAGEIKELFAAFLEKPGKETYLAVFKAVTEAESYDGYSMELDRVWDLIKEKKFKEAREKLEKAMPNLLLSPRCHTPSCASQPSPRSTRAPASLPTGLWTLHACAATPALDRQRRMRDNEQRAVALRERHA